MVNTFAVTATTGTRLTATIRIRHMGSTMGTRTIRPMDTATRLIRIIVRTARTTRTTIIRTITLRGHRTIGVTTATTVPITAKRRST